ncbi:ABC transporter substrate-binding protein [Paenibacillus sp. sgz302251]|uniref:ABC transporter substrate-binding protein n=1 Tax=Paenibacillus sp. sgz302251 TaxID=3414493 RepID=UPI003C7DBB15
MKKALSLTLTLALTISIITACGSKDEGSSNNEKVKIEFFQYKPEAVATYDALIGKFEAANPGIDVVQTNVPESATVLKTRVAKGDVPDIISTGGDAQFADLATNDILADLTDYAAQSSVIEGYKTTLKLITGSEELYGVPFAANANGIIYNKGEFEALGLSVPTTKDEMDNVLAVIKAAGKVPFHLTFKDAWTALPAWNVFAASLQPANFYADRAAKSTTFAAAHKDLMTQYLEFMQNGQPGDRFTDGYAEGNTAFAKGASVMYLQGVWAIPEILKANPEIKLGVFPYPVSNDKSKNLLVSGVDVLFAISATSKYPEEAKKFIDFMIQTENAQQYTNEQKSFSAIKGVFQNEESYSDLKPVFEEGRIADFPDHYINGMDLGIIVQELMQKKDIDAALKKMDEEYDKLATR